MRFHGGFQDDARLRATRSVRPMPIQPVSVAPWRGTDRRSAPVVSDPSPLSPTLERPDVFYHVQLLRFSLSCATK